MTQTKHVTVRVDMTAPEVAALQTDAEALAASLHGLTIDTPEEYTQVDAFLVDVVRRKDAALAMRRSATGPMREAVATVEGWFRPVVRALEAAEGALKGALGAYRLALDNAAREAREAAAVAAETGDAPALLAALADATTVAPTGAATATFRWAVACIDAEAVPREFLCVDRAKLDALAKGAPADGPAPVVAGVAFERVARIGARRG